MFSAMRVERALRLESNALVCGLKTKGAILGAGALTLMLFSSSAAQAQCVGNKRSARQPALTRQWPRRLWACRHP
jgi:hypothetical protein